MAETITIGTVTFVVAPEEVEPKPAPKETPKPTSAPKQTQRPSAPPCTASRSSLSGSKRGPDGYYHAGYIADRMWREKKKGRLERWGIWKTFEE